MREPTKTKEANYSRNCVLVFLIGVSSSSTFGETWWSPSSASKPQRLFLEQPSAPTQTLPKHNVICRDLLTISLETKSAIYNKWLTRRAPARIRAVMLTTIVTPGSRRYSPLPLPATPSTEMENRGFLLPASRLSEARTIRWESLPARMTHTPESASKYRTVLHGAGRRHPSHTKHSKKSSLEDLVVEGDDAGEGKLYVTVIYFSYVWTVLMDVVAEACTICYCFRVITQE